MHAALCRPALVGMRRIDNAAKVAAGVAILLAAVAITHAVMADSVEASRHAIALLLLVVIVVLVLVYRLLERLCLVRENRDGWVRICCMYRRGLRDRIERGEFATYDSNMAAMDRVDDEEGRVEEDYKRWKKERDADEALPE